MKSRYALALALCVVGWTPATFAEIYKWTDEHGKVHYSSVPPALPGKNSNVEQADIKVPPADRSNAYRIQASQQRRLNSFEQADRKKEREMETADYKRKQEARQREYREEQCEKYKQQYADIRSQDTFTAKHPFTGNEMNFTGTDAEDIKDEIKARRDEYCHP